MTTIATAARELRAQIRASNLSMREVARRAGISDKTVKLFLDGKPSKAPTVEAIEAAVANLTAEMVSGSDNHAQ